MQAKNPNKQAVQTQTGFGLLMFLLALTGLSSALFFAANNPETSKQDLLHNKSLQLSQAKTNLLNYALATPEIYATNTNGNFHQLKNLTPPGYFPCPAPQQNLISANTCGAGADFAVGFLPLSMATHHFQLQPDLVGENSFIWYFIDSRYLIQNTDFNNQSTKRFAPLNRQNPGAGSLQLNQIPNLVAVLAMPISNREINFNQPPDLANLNPTDYLTTSISHAEWNRAISSRVVRQAQVLCQLEPNLPHWFNQCNNPDRTKATCDFDENLPVNPSGTNWREILC